MDETPEQMQARHRKEQRDLQSRITSKKKNATKKTRKGVNDECTELERQLRERQDSELRSLLGEAAPAIPGQRGEDGEQDTGGDDAEQRELAGGVAGLSVSQRGEREQQEAQEQQTAKKRNRQKERLARRAAQQEAAAEAAAAEAAGMVDRRGLEREAMQATFATHGLVERAIAPDGHCLFAAVADQLAARGVALSSAAAASDRAGDADPPYRVVRHAAAAYMTRHADDFAGFLDEPLEAYVAKMRDTAEWGGALELSALANAYGVEIRVVQDGRTEVIRPTEDGAGGARREGEGKEGEEGADGKGGAEAMKTLWLAYYRHGYGLGEHYNSLRPPQTAS